MASELQLTHSLAPQLGRLFDDGHVTLRPRRREQHRGEDIPGKGYGHTSGLAAEEWDCQ